MTATGQAQISSTNVSHSAPDLTAPFTWSFTFNAGSDSGTAILEAHGNPVNADRGSDTNSSSLCGGAGLNTGTGGDGPFVSANTSIDINDQPVLTAGGGSSSYTEDGAAATVASALTLTDTEDSLTEIKSGSVTITTNYNSGDGDVLNIDAGTCTANNLVCSGSGTRTITISGGNESASEFQNVLRAITFSNTSENPSILARTVEFSITDDYDRVSTSTRGVTVARNEDPASFDSPVYNRIGTGTSSSNTQSVAEDSLIQLQFAATDPEAVSTTYSLESTTPTLVGPEPLIAVTAGGLLTWTPDGSRNSVTAVVGVNDNVGGTADATFSITLNVVLSNDAPEITEGASVTVGMTEDTPASFNLTLNATDIDLPPNTLTWSISTPASFGTAGLAGDGLGTSEAISYSPNLNLTGNGADSFVVTVSDGIVTDNITVTVDISAVNDPPVINTVTDFLATEGVNVNFNPGVTDPDDNNDGTDITWSFVSGNPVGMTISPTGTIDWTPPVGPPSVFNQGYPIVIQAHDGDVADTESFTITLNAPDADNDMVADYDDFCPAQADGTNADSDGDGTAGSDADPNDNVGGDECDADDDNDGMPDTYEDANGLDSTNAADAALDADGDGISNLQEYLDGTNPNFANITIDATGYLTSFVVPEPDPTKVHPSATAVSLDDSGPYRPGRNTLTWTGSNITNANLGTSSQTLDVRPLVNLGVNQQVAEGGAATVDVTLNGDPPEYPVNVTYTVAGTAGNPSDHNAVNGLVVFNSPDTSETIAFTTVADGISDPNETILFTITSATNAAVGSNNVHQVTIVEDNVAPSVDLGFSQGGSAMAITYSGGGVIDIDATRTDINAGQTHTYDWTGTDSALLPPGNVNTWQVNPGVCAVPPCNFLIRVTVTDNGSPPLSTQVSRILNISTGTAAVLGATVNDDMDGDGEIDATEGHGDDDGDGIPNYLDAHDSGPSDTNLLPDQTVDFDETTLLQTDAGLSLGSGNTARAAASFGALLISSQIEMYGSENGTPPANPNDDREHFGGIYNFEISGLVPGSSANIVIPLLSAIPRDAVYRKFNPATGWSSFVVDANNRIASATGELGACPEPGSSEYRDGLNYLDNCIQLTIQDGGPNDTDNTVNGIVSDPGTVGAQLSDPETSEVKDGSSRVSPAVLLIMMLLCVFGARRRMERVVSE